MKRRLRVAWLTALTILLLTGPAFAGGWGPYFSWGRETPSAGFPGSGIDDTVAQLPVELRELARAAMEEVDIDFRFDHFTIGIMYESAPARDKLLSYRATLGLNIAKAKVTDIESPLISSLPPVWQGLVDQAVDVLLGDVDNTGLGFSTKHTLAFGLIRNERLKWWVGPGVGFSFAYYNIGGPLDLEAAHLSIGGGGESGVNLHLGPGMSLAFSAGIHWNAFGYAIGQNDYGSFVWGNGPLYFIRTSLLFRTGPDRGQNGAEAL